MSKKRNLAVLMAAATVATSVAPVFAAETTESLDGKTISAKDSAKLDQLKAEVKALLDVKFVNDKDLLLEEDYAGQSVYTINATVTLNGKTPTTPEIKTMRDLDRELASFSNENDTIVLNVTDKGHKEVNGKILDNEVKNYKYQDMQNLKSKNNDELKVALNAIDATDAPNAVTEVDRDANAIYVTLQNNSEKLVLKTGVAKTVYAETDVDGNVTGIKADGVVYKEDAYGNKLDKDGKITTDKEDYVILGFKEHKEKITDLDDPKTFTINNKDSVQSVNISEIYNNKLNKFTQEGNEVAKFIRDYNKEDGSSIEISLDENTKLVVKVPQNKNGIENKFTTLTITGTVNEIANLQKALDAVNTGAATTLDVDTLAGLNREATAVEVSKSLYTDGQADNVVLVSGHSIADGLAATPFAKTKKAPILLSGKDSISKDVMDEIDRVMKNKGTVYLVGGTSSLSTGIEKQLDAKFIDFERIAGTDRMSTSLKIAQAMVKDNDDANGFKGLKDIFVAGGYAEADAMSVAAVAAQGGSSNLTPGVDPILLTGKDGLTDEQTNWLNRQSLEKAYIAGGENSVSTSVSTVLKNTTSKVYRLAGDNRQGTNAKVIKEFYADADSSKLFVAKADNNGLVDALPAGVLAAKDEAPVVLANDDLSADQTAALKNIKAHLKIEEDKGNKVQAGYGIADKVWEAINKILDQKQD